MAEVEWIKLTVGMFDNPKIKYLRKLPEGNNIVLIWIMLLTLAGKCNVDGYISLTKDIPYTTKMLADELGFEEGMMLYALDELEKLQMVHIWDGMLFVPGGKDFKWVYKERCSYGKQKNVQH